MSKQRRRRRRDPGQYVSPLLNELEWLDDQPEEKKAASRKKKRTRPKSESKQVSGKQTARNQTMEPEVFAASLPQASKRNNEAIAPPLMLLRPKPRTTGSRIARELFGYDSWAAQQADQIVDALQAFQLGLDGFLKEGERLDVVPPREQAAIIDISPEPEAGEQETRTAPAEQPAAGDAAGKDEMRGKEQQLYGLVPFRFGPQDERIDVTVTFGQPFVNDRYVLVATADQNGCRSVIHEKTPDFAVIRLIRSPDDSLMEGELNWIAIGDG